MMLKIDFSEVLRYLGYRPGLSELSQEFRNLILKEIEFAESLLQPAYRLVTFSRSELDKLEQEQQTSLWLGTDITAHLQGADYVTLMVATIGHQLEEEIAQSFASGDYTKGVILDAAGSDGVEKLADEITVALAAEAQKDGFYLTPRFSPGYGDWPLSVQVRLLELLEADLIGVTATESFMLQPQKTITAVVGWVRQPQVFSGACSSCHLTDCQYCASFHGGRKMR